MARTQVYGGKEADETRTGTAARTERQADNEVAESRPYGNRMQAAWALGADYGRRIVAEIYEEQLADATAYANTQDWSEKERIAFLAEAQKRAAATMASHTFGSPTGKRGPWRKAR